MARCATLLLALGLLAASTPVRLAVAAAQSEKSVVGEPGEEAALPRSYSECIHVGGHPGGHASKRFCFLEVDAEREMARFESCIQSGGSVFVTGGDHPSYDCVLMFREPAGPGD